MTGKRHATHGDGVIADQARELFSHGSRDSPGLAGDHKWALDATILLSVNQPNALLVRPLCRHRNPRPSAQLYLFDDRSRYVPLGTTTGVACGICTSATLVPATDDRSHHAPLGASTATVPRAPRRRRTVFRASSTSPRVDEPGRRDPPLAPGSGAVARGARHPGKSDGLLCQGCAMRFAFIHAHAIEHAIGAMCRAPGVEGRVLRVGQAAAERARRARRAAR